MRYVFREGLGVIEAHLAPPRARGPRSSLPSPAIRPDGMDTIRNHANGLLYDSKSAYYKGVKDAGCEIVGDEPLRKDLAPREIEAVGGVEQSIKDAIEQLGGS